MAASRVDFEFASQDFANPRGCVNCFLPDHIWRSKFHSAPNGHKTKREEDRTIIQSMSFALYSYIIFLFSSRALLKNVNFPLETSHSQKLVLKSIS